MTDQEIYLKFAGKNGWGDSDEINLSAKQLEKIILTACKYAREDGFINGRAHQIAQEKLLRPKSGASDDIFKTIFGGSN